MQVAYATDNNHHYALYADGDMAKMPGGGRKGASVLCELVPGHIGRPSFMHGNSQLVMHRDGSLPKRAETEI